MNESNQQLPEYRCHKVVRAAKIRGILFPLVVTNGFGGEMPQDGALMFDSGINQIKVSAEWMKKHSPQIGGYYVRYPDGYESWSPAEAFESGYTLIEAAQADLLVPLCNEFIAGLMDGDDKAGEKLANIIRLGTQR